MIFYVGSNTNQFQRQYISWSNTTTAPEVRLLVLVAAGRAMPFTDPHPEEFYASERQAHVNSDLAA